MAHNPSAQNLLKGYQMKTCYKCKEVKSKLEFYKDKFRKDGLTSKCKFCFKIYRQENIKKIIVTKQIYYQNNKEKYRKTNNDNKKRRALWCKKYEQANPERRLSIIHKRRALKLNADGTFNLLDIKTLLRIQNSKCVYCKTDLIMASKNKYHIDHKMPLFLGGSNYPENLQLLCPTCNLSKGHKHPDIYEKQINHNQNKELI